MPGPITTHILDTARGFPAIGIDAALEWQDEAGEWLLLGIGCTNTDGRIPDFLPEETPLLPGLYRITFETGEYFRMTGVDPIFYPRVLVEFSLGDSARHYHIPLLLSPFGYTTYRGS